jgi:hypothetical protein
MAALNHESVAYSAVARNLPISDRPDATELRTLAHLTIATGKTLVATAPTTAAGLAALATYLRHELRLRLFVTRPFAGAMMGGGDDAVEWLIAKRAAELEIARVR